MGDTKSVQCSGEGDQRGTNTSAGTSASPASFDIEYGERNTSCRLSFSRLEIVLMNAVVICAILSTIFIVMYFTIDKNGNNHCGSCPINKTMNSTMNKTKNMPKRNNTSKFIICPITRGGLAHREIFRCAPCSCPSVGPYLSEVSSLKWVNWNNFESVFEYCNISTLLLTGSAPIKYSLIFLIEFWAVFLRYI